VAPKPGHLIPVRVHPPRGGAAADDGLDRGHVARGGAYDGDGLREQECAYV
jgi:hypothetical protein